MARAPRRRSSGVRVQGDGLEVVVRGGARRGAGRGRGGGRGQQARALRDVHVSHSLLQQIYLCTNLWRSEVWCEKGGSITRNSSLSKCFNVEFGFDMKVLVILMICRLSLQEDTGYPAGLMADCKFCF